MDQMKNLNKNNGDTVIAIPSKNNSTFGFGFHLGKLTIPKLGIVVEDIMLDASNTITDATAKAQLDALTQLVGPFLLQFGDQLVELVKAETENTKARHALYEAQTKKANAHTAKYNAQAEAAHKCTCGKAEVDDTQL